MKLKKRYYSILECLRHVKFLQSEEYKDYVRKSDLKKKKRQPTEKQLLQRSNFGMANKFAQHIRTALEIGFKKSRYVTAANKGMRKFMAEAMVGMYPDNKIDYCKVAISDGLGAPEILPAVELSRSGFATLKWSYGHPKRGEPFKRIYVLFYNGTAKSLMFSDWVGVLSDDGATFKVKPFSEEDEIHCWFFTHAKGDHLPSASKYIREFNIVA